MRTLASVLLALAVVVTACDDDSPVAEAIEDVQEELREQSEHGDALEVIAFTRAETAQLRERVRPPAVNASAELTEPAGEIVIVIDGTRVHVTSPWLLEEWEAHPARYDSMVGPEAEWDFLPIAAGTPVEELSTSGESNRYPMPRRLWNRLRHERDLQRLLEVHWDRERSGALDIVVSDSSPAGVVSAVVHAALQSEHERVSILVTAGEAERGLTLVGWNQARADQRPPATAYIAVGEAGATVVTGQGALQAGCERASSDAGTVSVAGTDATLEARLLVCLGRVGLADDALIAVSPDRDVPAGAMVRALAAARTSTERVALTAPTPIAELIERLTGQQRVAEELERAVGESSRVLEEALRTNDMRILTPDLPPVGGNAAEILRAATME